MAQAGRNQGCGHQSNGNGMSKGDGGHGLNHRDGLRPLKGSQSRQKHPPGPEFVHRRPVPPTRLMGSNRNLTSSLHAAGGPGVGDATLAIGRRVSRRRDPSVRSRVEFHHPAREVFGIELLVDCSIERVGEIDAETAILDRSRSGWFSRGRAFACPILAIAHIKHSSSCQERPSTSVRKNSSLRSAILTQS